MNGFKVIWDKGTIELQSSRAALMLVEAFHDEDRTATAYALGSDGEWLEIS